MRSKCNDLGVDIFKSVPKLFCFFIFDYFISSSFFFAKRDIVTMLRNNNRKILLTLFFC